MNNIYTKELICKLPIMSYHMNGRRPRRIWTQGAFGQLVDDTDVTPLNERGDFKINAKMPTTVWEE